MAGFCLRFLRRGTPSGVFALVHVGATVPGMKIRAFPVLASTTLLQWILVVSLPIMLQVSVSFPVPILVLAVVLFVEGFLVVFQVFPSRTLRTLERDKENTSSKRLRRATSDPTKWRLESHEEPRDERRLGAVQNWAAKISVGTAENDPSIVCWLQIFANFKTKL